MDICGVSTLSPARIYARTVPYTYLGRISGVRYILSSVYLRVSQIRNSVTWVGAHLGYRNFSCHYTLDSQIRLWQLPSQDNIYTVEEVGKVT